jgi:hypothetical protein
MATPRAPTNMSILSTRRKFLETSRIPSPASIRTSPLFPAILIVDTTPPSVPTGLTVTVISNSQLDISWNASTDTGGSGLAGYRLYRDGSGTPLVQQSGLTYSDTGLLNGTQYTYRVSAYDGQGNESAQSSSVSGTTQTPGGSGSALQDWINRSTATGVVMATRFTQTSHVTSWTHNDGTQDHLEFRSTGGIIGDGCMRINVLPTDGPSSGQWRRPLNDSWTTNGNSGIQSEDYYIQFRCRFGPDRLTPSVNGGGNKLCIVGGYNYTSPNSSHSNVDSEVVVTNPDWLEIPIVYNHNAGQQVQRFQSGVGGFSTTQQPARDRGTSFSGLDRYCVYQNSSNPTSPGCWFFEEEEWFTVYMHLKQNTPGGSSGNRLELYVARDGETSYSRLFDETNFAWALDSTDAPRGLVGLWLLPYDTNRTSGTVTTYQEYDQVIVSTQPIACPQVAAEAGEPTWLASIGNLVRAAPVSNALSSASVKDPLAEGVNRGFGHNNIVDAWCGGIADPVNKEFALVCNGGHTNYHGNEAYKVSFEDDDLQWIRLRNATTAPGSGSLRTLSDGRPASQHSYTSPVACNGKWYLCGLHGTSYAGGSFPQALFEFLHPTHGLDNTNNDYVDHGNPLIANGNTGNICSLYDPTENLLIVIAGGNSNPSIRFMNATTRAVTANNTNALNDGCSGFSAGYDSTHRNILLRGNAGWWTVRMSARTAAWQQPSASGVSVGTTNSFPWHEASGKFLTWVQGTGLVRGTPTFNGSGDITSIAWSAVSTSGVSVATITGNGLMNRIGIAPAVGGGRDVFYFLPTYGPLIVIPLPFGGV